MDISKFRIIGLTAATFTPFKPNGDLNLDLIDTFVDRLVNDGIRNIFVNGTTSEGMHLTVEERKLTAEKWMQVSKNKMDKVIIHVGGSNLREARDLAQHAERIGANAISTLPTVFLKPRTHDGLAAYLKELSEAAPNIPLYYYHIPSMTGVNFHMATFLDHIGDSIPTFRGMKYTASDLHDFCECLRHRGGKFDILYGTDECILAALIFGGKGFVGSTYNYSGKICNRIIDAYNKGDIEAARKATADIQSVVGVMKKHGGGSCTTDVNKCTMQLTGLDVGPPRLPLQRPSKETRESMLKDLKAVNFFDLIK